MDLVLGRVVGLDVGSHAVKVVVLRQSLRALELERVKAMPAPPPGAPAADAMRNFFRAHRIPTDRVACSIPGDRATRRHLRLPFRDRRRIAQAVPFEVEGEVPFPLEEIFVDWELVGGEGPQTEVAATVVPRSEVLERLTALREAGLSPRVLEAEGLVLANLAEVLDLPGSRVLLDLGHRKTTFCLLVDGQPRAARTFAVGGAMVTKALAGDRGLSLPDAERAKCEEGIFTQGLESRAPRASAVLDRLVRELLRTLGGLEPALGGPAKSHVTELTLLGGGARLHRIDEYLGARTGLRAARLAVPPTPLGKAFLAAGDPLRYAPALALAVRGTLRTRTRMNFLQEEFARRVDLGRLRSELRWTTRLAAAVVMLALLLAGTAVALNSRRTEQLERRTQELWTEAFPGRPVPADVPRAMRDALREAQQRAEFLGVHRGNLSALDLLTEISARVPADVNVIFEELSIDGQLIRIRGHTPSFEAVDQLRAALAGGPFADAKVGEIQSDSVRGGNTFSVTISLGASEGAR